MLRVSPRDMRLKKVWPQIVCLVLALVVTALLELVEISPNTVGFHLDDISVRRQYKKSETVPTWMVVIFFLILPFLFSITIDCWKFSPRLVLMHAMAFVFGAAATTMITNVGKLSFGRLRPDWVERCGFDQASSTIVNDFVQTCVCSNTDMKALIDGRKSFPSGHSSVSAYGSVYLILIAHYFSQQQSSFFSRSVFQLGCASAAVYVMASRYIDNRHHPGDIFAGAMLGLFVAIITIRGFTFYPQLSTQIIKAPKVKAEGPENAGAQQQLEVNVR